MATIRIMFKDYQSLKDPQARQALRTSILVLCRDYLPTEDEIYTGRVDQDMLLIEDMYQVVRRDEGQALAQARYVTDAYEGDPTSQLVGTQSPTKLTTWKPDVQNVLIGASAVQSGQAVPGLGGASQTSIDVAQQYGLTHAEIVAIRAYTAANYEFINPATENNRRGGGHDDRKPGEQKSLDWMMNQNKKQARVIKPGTGTLANPAQYESILVDLNEEELERHFAEGSLHAGVLMMGLAKLPDIHKDLFRGERLTPEEFKDNYVKKKVYKINSFKSNSADAAEASKFANGLPTTPGHKTVSVLCVLKAHRAKDIKDLSIFPREAEYLLMPGAVFAITKVVEEQPGKFANPEYSNLGNPPATDCYTVYLTQTA